MTAKKQLVVGLTISSILVLIAFLLSLLPSPSEREDPAAVLAREEALECAKELDAVDAVNRRADWFMKAPEFEAAARAVAAAAKTYEVNPIELETRRNPKGQGIFVWAEYDLLHHRTATAVWLVVDGVPYPLNSRARVTTRTPWPNEADHAVWRKTRLSPWIRIIDDKSIAVRERVESGTFDTVDPDARR